MLEKLDFVFDIARGLPLDALKEYAVFVVVVLVCVVDVAPTRVNPA